MHGMQKMRRESAVIRKKKETFRFLIQTPNRKEIPIFFRKGIHDGFAICVLSCG
jgi:hypothetical protein